MSKFREATVSNNEKKFTEDCLIENLRVDGRAFDEFRELKIQFGSDWGSCHVALGKTQVLAQVSCEVQVPKSTRPSEGILYVNLELSPLAAPQFEVGRPSDLSVQLNRLLEKCIKDSKAVDLESLCIKVNEKVWAFRVDCNVLNDEGNIVDAASIAALAALAHFRRPDVTCDGEEVIIHTYAQRDSIPTVIHHYPVCVSYAIFNNGDIILADPTLLEDQVSEAQLTIGLNSYKELCGFHLAGSAMMSPEQILQTTNRAATRANTVISLIKKSLAEDTEARQDGKQAGFSGSYLFDDSVDNEKDRLALSEYLNTWTTKTSKKRAMKEKTDADNAENTIKKECLMPAVVEQINKQSAALVPPHTEDNKWDLHSDAEDDDEEDVKPDIELIPMEEDAKLQRAKKGKQTLAMDTSDSEEETTIVLNADKLTKKTKGRRK